MGDLIEGRLFELSTLIERGCLAENIQNSKSNLVALKEKCKRVSNDNESSSKWEQTSKGFHIFSLAILVISNIPNLKKFEKRNNEKSSLIFPRQSYAKPINSSPSPLDTIIGKWNGWAECVSCYAGTIRYWRRYYMWSWSRRKKRFGILT